MRAVLLRILTLFYGLCLAAAFMPARPCAAQATAPGRQPLRVATRVVAPFVVEENGALKGFSIELWDRIAQRMGVKYRYVKSPTVKDLLEDVRTGKADIGISAISITAERDKSFDFSQPMYESGLQIMVRRNHGTSSLWSRFASVISPALLQLIGLILIIVLVPAHIVWLLERHHSEGIIKDKTYFPGIFEAIWWAAATLATQADSMPRHALARVVAVIWMFTSVVFVAYFTAQVTTSLTVQQLHSDITGPDDLPGKRVATVTGSTSAQYLRDRNIPVIEFPRVDDACAALADEQADAVVYDAPVLRYYASHAGHGQTDMVGPVFRKENYGIVLPPNSRYREPVNQALLTLRENGEYDELNDKWFGGE
jgi:polar amino acid transport system substrate-binding protein